MGVRDYLVHWFPYLGTTYDFFARSLDAFGREAAGDRARAARSLAALEWESADRSLHAGYGQRHPHVSAVHRLSASRWLLAVGDTSQAARLLSWHEVVLVTALHRPDAVNRMLGPLALLERARIEEARGLHDLAREHYAGFVERYDMPLRAQAALVEEAPWRRSAEPEGASREGRSVRRNRGTHRSLRLMKRSGTARGAGE